MSLAPAASSEAACWRIGGIHFGSEGFGISGGLYGYCGLAVRCAAWPVRREPFAYSICIAATGICGPASAVDTLRVSWTQADLICHVLPGAPRLQGVPEQARHGGQVLAPAGRPARR